MVSVGNRAYRSVGALFWLGAAAMGALGFYDARARYTGVTDTSPGWLTTAACLVLAFRAMRLGVTVTDDHVVVRSWLRTVRLVRGAVAGARAVPYRGALAPRPWSQLLMVELELPDQRLGVPAVPGLVRSGRVQEWAAQLSTALSRPAGAAGPAPPPG